MKGIKLELENIDELNEKVSQLVCSLKEATELINSLSKSITINNYANKIKD